MMIEKPKRERKSSCNVLILGFYFVFLLILKSFGCTYGVICWNVLWLLLVTRSLVCLCWTYFWSSIWNKILGLLFMLFLVSFMSLHIKWHWGDIYSMKFIWSCACMCKYTIAIHLWYMKYMCHINQIYTPCSLLYNYHFATPFTTVEFVNNNYNKFR